MEILEEYVYVGITLGIIFGCIDGVCRVVNTRSSAGYVAGTCRAVKADTLMGAFIGVFKDSKHIKVWHILLGIALLPVALVYFPVAALTFAMASVIKFVGVLAFKVLTKLLSINVITLHKKK